MVIIDGLAWLARGSCSFWTLLSRSEFATQQSHPIPQPSRILSLNLCVFVCVCTCVFVPALVLDVFVLCVVIFTPHNPPLLSLCFSSLPSSCFLSPPLSLIRAAFVNMGRWYLLEHGNLTDLPLKKMTPLNWKPLATYSSSGRAGTL